MTIQQPFEIALQHHQSGRLAEAEALYRQILAVEPRHADALHLLGVIAHQVGRDDLAIDLIRQAIALAPDVPHYHSNLGEACRAIGELDEAIAAYRNAIALKPDYPGAHYNLGNALIDKGQLDEAVGAYRQAVALKSDYPAAHTNLGNALREKGQPDEAIAAYRQAIALQPTLPEAHSNLGAALRDMGHLDEAIAACRQALALHPDFPEVHNNLGTACRDRGQPGEAIAAHRQALALKPDASDLHSNLLLTLNYDPGWDAPAIAEEHRRWNRQHAEPLRSLIEPQPNDRDPERRLRIGYVSPDFREHVVARFLLPLFENHDRQAFEVFAYAQVPAPDAMTQRLRTHTDRWRSLVGLSDAQAAALIRQDRIDILVDLALHTAGHRLLVFARKPAPVQVTFAGYPGSTGLAAMGYRLSDPYLDPPGADETLSSEQTLRLPHSFWCYDPLDCGDLPVGPLPAELNGGITFGCLNNFCKINDGVLRLWSKVLQTVPSSRLFLLAPEGSPRQHTLDVFRQEGIASGRIEFVSPRPRREYLELYHRIDVGLDTLPYNGHTTSLDSFWMGVPVVTLVGQTIVGRAGLSQSMNLGLPELIASTSEEFVRIASGLAKDLPRLAHLRSTLRQRMEASPLMDAAGFARDIEVAYRQMWRQWCLQEE